jgi:hypothetical protein
MPSKSTPQEPVKYPKPFLNAVLSALAQTPHPSSLSTSSSTSNLDHCQHILLNLHNIPAEECDAEIHVVTKSLACLFGVSAGILRCTERTQPEDFYRRSVHPSLSPTSSSTPYYKKYCLQAPSLVFADAQAVAAARGNGGGGGGGGGRGDDARASGNANSSNTSNSSSGKNKMSTSSAGNTGRIGGGNNNNHNNNNGGGNKSAAANKHTSGLGLDDWLNRGDAKIASLDAFQFDGAAARGGGVGVGDVLYAAGSGGDRDGGGGGVSARMKLGGPIFADIFIVHNLDLVPAHTQAMLLQAMRLKKIFIDGAQRSLPSSHGRWCEWCSSDVLICVLFCVAPYIVR